MGMRIAGRGGADKRIKVYQRVGWYGGAEAGIGGSSGGTGYSAGGWAMSRDLPQRGSRRGLRGPGRKNSERMYR